MLTITLDVPASLPPGRYGSTVQLLSTRNGAELTIAYADFIDPTQCAHPITIETVSQLTS